MDKVSIIIPVYNAEKYIAQCLESVINQTYQELEILVVNDGSTDQSKVLCENYAKKDVRIQLYNKKNEGASIARNFGIEHSTGKWIAFVDSDDWLELEFVQKALQDIVEYRADIVSYNNFYNTEEIQTKRKPIYPEVYNYKGEEIENVQLDILALSYDEINNGRSVGPLRGPCGKLYKASLIKENEVTFNPNLYAFEDAIFNLYVLNHTTSIVISNQYLYHYRMHKKSTCKAYKPTWLEQNKEILKEIDQFILKSSKKEEFKKTARVTACELFSSCLSRSVFHKDNTEKLNKKLKILKEYIRTEPFYNAFEKVEKKYLNKKQKIVVMLAKKKRVRWLYFLYKIKEIVKA